jgi:RNA polymerase sigma-70 factor, ECF subfamily
VPDRPGAWLTVSAWRKALDRMRRERVDAACAAGLEQPVAYEEAFDLDRSALDDDTLRMLFTCCHPALAPEARMALTLRSVAGLTVPEIARAFLSSESAMERRLVRHGARSRTRGSRSGCRRTSGSPNGWTGCCASSTSSTPRGT